MVRPVKEARVFDLLVFAHAVEAELFDQLDIALEGRVIRRGQAGLRPVSLVEHEPQKHRPAVEDECAALRFDLPHGGVASDVVDDVVVGIEQVKLRVD
jgi:hypothetical protein